MEIGTISPKETRRKFQCGPSRRDPCPSPMRQIVSCSTCTTPQLAWPRDPEASFKATGLTYSTAQHSTGRYVPLLANGVSRQGWKKVEHAVLHEAVAPVVRVVLTWKGARVQGCKGTRVQGWKAFQNTPPIQSHASQSTSIIEWMTQHGKACLHRVLVSANRRWNKSGLGSHLIFLEKKQGRRDQPRNETK